MPFSASNNQITGRKPVRTPSGAELVAERFELDLATGDLALNTIGQIGILPAGCVPVDVIVDADDLDTGAAAMVLQVGIWDGSGANLSTAAADGGAHWGVTTAANTAFVQRLTPNAAAMARVQNSQTERRLGVKVATAPTAAAAGKLGVTLVYRAA
jgi:hypothetical protein